MKEKILPFAYFGSEKMFYDLRMGPQLVRHNDHLYCVYQANGNEIYADPYIMRYSITDGSWEGPYLVGRVGRAGFDHHLCPVMWIDENGFIHVLFNCHGESGCHRISTRPYDITSFSDGPIIYRSISYPHIFRIGKNSVLLYFRVFGHMGYWAYMTSRDGGYSWSEPRLTVDFDQDPLSDADTWAGSYHSCELSEDASILHIAFTYFDERGIWKYVHPRYGRKTSVNSRYNLYYLRLDLGTGTIMTYDGTPICHPLNRSKAEIAKVWDSSDYLTMQPALLVDGEKISFLTVVTGDTEWNCTFRYFKKVGDRFVGFDVCKTNTTWSGCRLLKCGQSIIAYLIRGEKDGSNYTYGAGEMEKWESLDEGETWHKVKSFTPIEGYLYNNPIIAEDYMNSGLKDSSFVAFYGWEGPYSMQPVIDKETNIPIINRGMAFLLWNERYVNGVTMPEKGGFHEKEN